MVVLHKLKFNSPFTFFSTRLGYETPCYTATFTITTCILAGAPISITVNGLPMKILLNREPFKKILGTEPQLWQLKEIGGISYGAHSFDLLKINRQNVNVYGLNVNIVWNINSVKDNPQLLLAGENNGIYVLKKVNNNWQLRNKIKGYSDLGRYIEVDNDNNYWCSTYGEKIYKLRFNDNFDSVTYLKNYNISSNYPLATSNRLTIINNKIIVSGGDGFYLYNSKKDIFEPYTELNKHIVKGAPVNIMGYDKKGTIWFTDSESTGELDIQPDGSYKINRMPFCKFDIPSESYPVFPVNDSIVILCQSNEFVYYNRGFKKDYNVKYNTIIRRMELLNTDSVIFEGDFNKAKNSEVNINYNNNSIRFDFTATYYENVEKNRFQYKLEGYDKNWSNWISDSKKEYTNLPEGQYTFYIRSRNVFSNQGTTDKIDFYIRPPFYRTLWAYLGYTVFTTGLVYLIVFLNSRRLKEANLKLEEIIKERTIEITNQKEVIQSQFEQLKEAQGIKDKFYSIISHDLINAVGNLKSFSEILKSYTSTLNDDKLIKYSNGLYSASTVAFDLLTNLLNWTRLQSGRMKTNFEKINLIVLIKDVINLYANIIEKKKLIIETDYPDYLYIYADKNMISTVLRNLLSNAIKFTPENGKISISLSYNENNCKFEIIDTGIGMTIEEQQKLFRKDIFFQRQGTNFESGTGFGLLLIKEFIELHKGKITVESEPSKGSKFTFIIPQSDLSNA